MKKINNKNEPAVFFKSCGGDTSLTASETKCNLQQSRRVTNYKFAPAGEIYR